MDTKNLTDQQIWSRFEAGQDNLESLIEPLMALVEESSSLVVGYGIAQTGVRETMIPYFHVCGARAEHEPVRALVIGGWVGTESVTPCAAARLLAAMESRLSAVAGIEVTAFPVANLEAHREKVFLSSGQRIENMRCWEDSPCSHVRVIERELQRYDYDAVILLRENSRAFDAHVEAWLTEDVHKEVLSDTLARYATASPEFQWKVNPVHPIFARSFTPIPAVEKQPAEIIVALPTASGAENASSEGVGLVLTLLHAMRQAREEGLL